MPEQFQSRPKSSDEIQAQIASFAADTLARQVDRAYVRDHVSELAQESPEVVSRPPTVEEEDKNIGEVTVATHAEYVKHLQETKKGDQETIRYRIKMLGAFSKFENDLKSIENTDELGHGATSIAYPFEHNGRNYVARVIQKDGSANEVDRHMEGGMLAQGLPHVEQIVAASYDRGIVISELMPGRPIPRLSLEDIEAMTGAQVDEFLSTLLDANARGISVDASDTANFFYDPEEGFGIIDCSSLASDRTTAQTPDIIVAYVTTMVANAGTPYKHTDSKELRLQKFEAQQRVLHLVRETYERRLTGGIQAQALGSVDSALAANQRVINGSDQSPQFRAAGKMRIQGDSDEYI